MGENRDENKFKELVKRLGLEDVLVKLCRDRLPKDECLKDFWSFASKHEKRALLELLMLVLYKYAGVDMDGYDHSWAYSIINLSDNDDEKYDTHVTVDGDMFFNSKKLLEFLEKLTQILY